MEGRSKATYFRIERLLSQIRASALKSNFNSETFDELKGYILNILVNLVVDYNFDELRLYPRYIPENLVVDYDASHRLNYEGS